MKHAASATKKSTTGKQTTTPRKRKPAPPTPEQILREALAPYVSVRRLQHLAAREPDLIHRALQADQVPPEVQAIMHVLAAVLRPVPTERISQAADVAALLLVEMGMLTQEQMRVVYLSTKHHIQTIKIVSQGTLRSAPFRPVELFHEAIRRNSAAIILVHNHPSGDPTPSPEDLFVTQQAMELGQLLGVTVLDHLVIGRGRWISINEEYPIVR